MAARTGFTTEGAQKAFAAAVVSIAAVVGFFVAVDPSTVESVVAIGGAVLNVVGVYLTRNRPANGLARRVD
jgi:hypothetical protein